MKQTDRVPHKARGAAEKRTGVPAQSAGTTKTSYPLMKYLSLLLAVALLFSGVTFARYLSNDRIDSSVGIARFDATYSIDRVNSTTFGNQNYWIETGTSGDIPQGAGTAITVGITLKNNGDTSVQPTLHLEGPKEYWDHIALQLTTARNVAAGTVLTPQLVIGDIAAAKGNSFETSTSKDYGSLGGGDPVLSLSGNIDAEGVRTATWTYGEGENAKMNKMTITKKTDAIIDYSVGFVRQSEDAFLPPFYVDCRKKTDIYSIDLELPALEVAEAESADGNRTAEQRVVVWLTWTTGVPNNSQAANSKFWEAIAAGVAPEGVKDQSGQDITILGYHFDRSGVPVVDKSGAATGETTTVRVKNTFGDTAGTLTTEYFHIASLDEAGQDSAYPHAAKLVEELVEEKKVYLFMRRPFPTYFDVSDVESTFTNEDINLIKWEEVKDAEEGDITSTTYAPVHERSFGISFKATFVQSSEVP